ncbi:MAG: aldo/keto reductase [Pseudomonadota bacterium]
MIDRRHFLGSSIGAAAALGVPAIGQATGAHVRRIPSSGTSLPAVGLGTWMTFNVGQDPVLLNRSVDVMRAFFKEGGGMIDSSPMYGSAQRTLGHGLQELGVPDTLFAADKVWTSADNGPAQLAETQAAWRLNGFDLMQVHNLVDVEEHLEMLFARKASGQIAHVGVTTSHGRRHDELEEVMRRYPLDFVQLTYNVLDREAEDRLLPLARDRGIGIIVNRPYRRGGLISRTKGAPLPGFAAELGAGTWAELMLKFVLSHPAVTVVIPATTQPSHVVQNKTAARTALPDRALREQIAERVAKL